MCTNELSIDGTQHTQKDLSGYGHYPAQNGNHQGGRYILAVTVDGL